MDGARQRRYRCRANPVDLAMGMHRTLPMEKVSERLPLLQSQHFGAGLIAPGHRQFQGPQHVSGLSGLAARKRRGDAQEPMPKVGEIWGQLLNKAARRSSPFDQGPTQIVIRPVDTVCAKPL